MLPFTGHALSACAMQTCYPSLDMRSHLLLTPFPKRATSNEFSVSANPTTVVSPIAIHVPRTDGPSLCMRSQLPPTPLLQRTTSNELSASFKLPTVLSTLAIPVLWTCYIAALGMRFLLPPTPFPNGAPVMSFQTPSILQMLLHRLPPHPTVVLLFTGYAPSASAYPIPPTAYQ